MKSMDIVIFVPSGLVTSAKDGRVPLSATADAVWAVESGRPRSEAKKHKHSKPVSSWKAEHDPLENAGHDICTN